VLFNWHGWQLCLHKWWRSDEDRALHDHKSDNISIILSLEGFAEIVRTYACSYAMKRPTVEAVNCNIRDRGYFDSIHHRWPFVPHFRRAETPHRVVLYSRKPVWSLWFRWPPIRRWGFHCPKGWVDADVFLSTRGQADGVGKYYQDGISEKGQGCD
jgi:hypothetical protein